jgi:ParB-like chromosome segregation protein Spo0J
MRDNPWLGILSQRGKDEDSKLQRPEGETVEPALVPESGTKHTEIASSSQNSRRRGVHLLEASLQAYELHLQHFSQNEIAGTLGVTSRQVHNYIGKAKAYLGVPEGMKHAALAEIMLAIKRAWMMFYKSEDPRVKVLWFRAALSGQIHRDRLLGLLTDRTVQFEELKQT